MTSAVPKFDLYPGRVLTRALALLVVLCSVATKTFAFVIGDRVQVYTSIGVKVRSTPAGTQIDSVAVGHRGKIIDGPQTASLGGVSYKWWKIDWDDSGDSTGWSAEGDASENLISLIPTATVSFQSQPSGVHILLSPNDVNGNADGDATFSRIWDYDARITLLVSSPLADGKSFVRWLKNGSQFSTSTYVTNVAIVHGDIFKAEFALQPPSAPTALETIASASEIELGWTDNSNNESGFKIERRVNGGSWTQIDTVGANSDNSDFYTDSDVSGGNSYSYRVRAYNASGNSAYTNEATNSLPGAVSLAVNYFSGGALSVSEMNAVLLFSPNGTEVARKQPPTGNPVNFSSVAAGNYYFFVFCWDMLAAESGTFTHGTANSNVTATTYLKRPLTVTVRYSDGTTPLNGATVNLQSWNGQYSQWYDRASGTTDSNGAWTIDAWPTAHTGEKYRVLVSYGGNSVGSADPVTVSASSSGGSASVTTTVTAPAGPSPPVLVSPGTNSRLTQPTTNCHPTFTWQKVTGATRYGLYISNGQAYGDTYQIESITDGNTITFDLPPQWLTPDTEYWWSMRAFNSSAVASAYSSPLYFVTGSRVLSKPTLISPGTSASPGTNISSTTPTLKWNKLSNAASYAVFVSQPPYGVQNIVHWQYVNQSSSSTVSYQVPSGTLASNTVHRWQVVAYNSGGFESLASALLYFNTGSSGPLTITLSSPSAGQTHYNDASILVTWSVSGDTTALDQFRFAYSTDGGGFSSDVLVSGASGATSHLWVPPPALNSGNVKVRIRALNSTLAEIASAASGAFSVTPRPQNALKAKISVPVPASPSVGQAASFSGLSSSPAGEITDYIWQFSDRPTLFFSGSTIPYSFSKAGPSWVRLWVKRGAETSLPASHAFEVKGTGLAEGQTPFNYSPDPVNLATGNFIMDNVDLSMPGRGLPFQFRRFYNSHAYTPPASGDPPVVPGPLGHSWRHSFEMSVGALDANSQRAVRWDDGHVDLHTFAAGEYQPATGVYDKLVENGDQTLTLTTKAQVRYLFDSSGKLTAIKDRNENNIAITYDLADRVDFVTDTVGRVIDFQYNGDGRLIALEHDLSADTSTTPPTTVKRRIEYEYDANQDLRVIRDARGKPTSLVYDALHQITEGYSAKGHRFVKNEYGTGDYARAVVKQWDALDHLSRFEYNFTTRVTQFFDALCETDAARQPEIHEHDEKLRLIRRTDPGGFVEEFGYDASGNRTTVKDKRGNVMTYQYDPRGNVTRKIAPLQNGVKILEDTVITYNALNDPETRTDPSGAITKWDYDLKGNVSAVTFPFVAATPERYKRSFVVNQHGQVTDKLNARGFNTHIDYDAMGNPWKVTDALGGETESHFDLAGRVIKTIDALDRPTDYLLDAADHLLRVRRYLGGQPVDTVSTYDDNGNPETVTDPLNRTGTFYHDEKDRQFKTRVVVDGENRDTVTLFDALDRKTKVTDPRGVFTAYTYDQGGRVERIENALGEKTDFKHDNNGNVTESKVVATGMKSTFEYDVLNRQTKATDANLNSARTEFNLAGQVWKTFDALDRPTVRTYDLAGNLATVTDPNPTPGALPVEFGCDDEGNRESMRDPRGKLTTYQNDALNRRTSETQPTSPATTTHWRYDLAGNLDETTDGKGQAIGREYDELHRLKKIIYPTGPPVTFGYDLAGNRTSMVDAVGTTTWTYDELNRPKTLADPFGLALGFGYDKSGNRSSVTYPGNRTASYDFDLANRLTKVTDWQTREITQTYDSTGRLDTISLPNGTSTKLGYDNASRLTRLTHRKGTDAPFADYTYALGATGTVDATTGTEPLAPTLAPGTTTYTYDDANQLATLNGNAVTHDGNGNLTAARLSPQSTANDALAFDQENRLTSATIAGQTTASTYNGLGHRLAMARGGQTTRFLVDGTAPLAQIMADTDGSGNPTAFYLYAGGLAARILPDGTPAYYHADRRGSTVALTDATGAVTDRYAYGDFGEPAGSTGSSTNPFRYLGRFGVHDTGDGTLFVRARHYHPDLGRFLSRDPLTGRDTQPQALNRYIYALNTPLALVDVSGFAGQEMSGFAGSTVAYTSDQLHQPLLTADQAYWRTFWREFGKGVATDIGIIGSSAIPGVGEAQDLAVLADPNSPGWQRWMASGSLALSAATDGLTPNAGSFIRVFNRDLGSSADGMVTVYRGVHAEHPQLSNAHRGIAEPIGGHSDPFRHNEGDNASIFTSWSTDRTTSVNFALRNGPGGVLLEQSVPRSSLIMSPDFYSESEVLRSGTVSGATPIILSR